MKIGCQEIMRRCNCNSSYTSTSTSYLTQLNENLEMRPLPKWEDHSCADSAAHDSDELWGSARTTTVAQVTNLELTISNQGHTGIEPSIEPPPNQPQPDPTEDDEIM